MREKKSLYNRLASYIFTRILIHSCIIETCVKFTQIYLKMTNYSLYIIM